MITAASRTMLTPLRAFLLLRYTLIAATAYLILVEDRFSVPAIWSCAAIAFALLSNVFASMLPSRIVHSRWFTTAFFVADTTWVTAALIASGRFEADFFFVYFFVMLLAAMAESLALIAVAAIAVCVAYLYVLSSGEQGWSLWNSPSVIRLPFLFTAAGFYGYMIDRTRSQERRVTAADALARGHGEALAAVSLQIRAPITSLLSWASLLLDTSLDPEQRRYADRMRGCGDQILSIADGILDTATMQAGTVPIEAVAFEPHAVVEEVCAQRMAAAREKGLALAHHVDPAVPLLLLGARSRVRQVLTTLVDNAIDFSESGDIRIGARLVSVGPDDVQIRFDVTDCSSALASDRQAALFAEIGAHDESDGPAPRGAALAVCRRVVAALRGEIGIETVFGGNNVFWFTIRCSEVGATQAPGATEGPVTIRTAARAVSIEEDGPSTRRTGS